MLGTDFWPKSICAVSCHSDCFQLLQFITTVIYDLSRWAGLVCSWPCLYQRQILCWPNLRFLKDITKHLLKMFRDTILLNKKSQKWNFKIWIQLVTFQIAQWHLTYFLSNIMSLINDIRHFSVMKIISYLMTNLFAQRVAFLLFKSFSENRQHCMTKDSNTYT